MFIQLSVIHLYNTGIYMSSVRNPFLTLEDVPDSMDENQEPYIFFLCFLQVRKIKLGTKFQHLDENKSFGLMVYNQ